MAERVLIEVCVDSAASAVAAERGGAARIELCGSLVEGGITPSAGMIESVRKKISLGLQVIVRPRPGDFYYDSDELAIMRRDIAIAKEAGADGVVFGILSREGKVDIPHTRDLVQLARPMNVTFHRAFDMSDELFKALEDVCAGGADRILTSGGEKECSQGAKTIARLRQAAHGRIIIMAGGGIRYDNVASIIESTGVPEIHVGLSRLVASPMTYRNSRVSLGKTEGREYQRWQVLEESVRKLHRSLEVSAS